MCRRPAESYIGLVEVGVGLIPAGGGTKEMLARSMDALPPGADVLPFVQRVFETIGFASVSTSGPDAQRLGYLRAGDAITMNRERLVADAKTLALSLVGGYVPPQPRSIPVGGASVLAALKLGVHLAWRAGRISDHDALIGRKLAWILAGGDIPARCHGERAAPAGSGARGLPQPVRRAEDAGADRPHAEDRETATELASLSWRAMRRSSVGAAVEGWRSRAFDAGDEKMFDRTRPTGRRRAGTPGALGMDEAGADRARADCRTISYTLSGDIGSGSTLQPELGFENYTRQLEDVLERAGLKQAVICGVSFGGFVALRYAARHPERVSALILASAPGPGWRPSQQQADWISQALVVSAGVPGDVAAAGLAGGQRGAAPRRVPARRSSRVRGCAAWRRR